MSGWRPYVLGMAGLAAITVAELFLPALATLALRLALTLRLLNLRRSATVALLPASLLRRSRRCQCQAFAFHHQRHHLRASLTIATGDNRALPRYLVLPLATPSPAAFALTHTRPRLAAVIGSSRLRRVEVRVAIIAAAIILRRVVRRRLYCILL